MPVKPESNGRETAVLTVVFLAMMWIIGSYLGRCSVEAQEMVSDQPPGQAEAEAMAQYLEHHNIHDWPPPKQPVCKVPRGWLKRYHPGGAEAWKKVRYTGSSKPHLSGCYYPNVHDALLRTHLAHWARDGRASDYPFGISERTALQWGRLIEAYGKAILEPTPYVCPDPKYEKLLEQWGDVEDTPITTFALPWHLDALSPPMDGKWLAPDGGEGQHVYVIDTGVDCNHPELEGRCGEGHSVFPEDPDPGDLRGHGTHVASIIAGKNVGVAPGVTIHSVRVFSNTQGATLASRVVAGINWSLQHCEIGDGAVDEIGKGWCDRSWINMSLGGPTNPLLNLATCRAARQMAGVVVAAGNHGGTACKVSPARVDLATTVAASKPDGGLAGFSARGECVDVSAPGQMILAACLRGRTYCAMSGTSMASPGALGVLAREP